jgi:hypothetical protein
VVELEKATSVILSPNLKKMIDEDVRYKWRATK